MTFLTYLLIKVSNEVTYLREIGPFSTILASGCFTELCTFEAGGSFTELCTFEGRGSFTELCTFENLLFGSKLT